MRERSGFMNKNLENLKTKIEKLPTDELFGLLDHITNQLRQRTALNGHKPPIADRNIRDQDEIYFVTPEEVEAELAELYTPEELALLNSVDLNNLPKLPKSLSEYLLEDREESRY